MKSNALTRDELIEVISPLGNHPVVWTGQTGFVKDAVGTAVLIYEDDTPLIGLRPASVQSNVGDVPTTKQVVDAREKLRVAKNRFADTFALYTEGHIKKTDFVAVKREYDAVVGQVIESLNRF